MKFRKFAYSLIFLTLGFFAVADNWTLASEQFKFRQKEIEGTAGSSINTVLPQLILEQIAEKGMRSIPAREQLDRELNKLQTERLSLFLQLSKENKTRDAFVLSKDKPGELRKNLKESDKKIAELEEKIDQNLKSVEETKLKYKDRLAKEAGLEIEEQNENVFKIGHLSFPFFLKDDEEKPVLETVVLYKNDNAAVFVPGEEAKNAGIKSYAYNKQVTGSNINGLLTGDISVYGDYISATVNLYLFPGAKCAGTVTEVGNTSDLMSMAQNIVHNLTPKLANSLPVKIRVEIDPPEARRTALVNVDGVIFPINDSLIVDAGVHSVTISAQDYESQTINYSFAGEELFTVKTKLKPLVSGTLDIRLKKLRDGIFYFNAMEQSAVDKNENIFAKASVNGRPVLGIFEEKKDGKESDKAFIYIPADLAVDSSMLKVNAKPFDRAKNIDKRRKMMYTAYSVLICSLVPTFYCVGNFTAATNSYNSRRGTFDDAKKWQQYTYYSMGVSGLAGVWFTVEIVRYLHAANQVLPATATTTNK